MRQRTKCRQAALNDMAKGMEYLKRTYKAHEVFNDFLDFILQLLNIDKQEKDFAIYEKKYSGHLREVFIQLYRDFITASENDGKGLYDALGDLYMEFMGQGSYGACFTPPEMCDLQASIAIRDTPLPGQTVCDPACGSGRTLLACAKIERKMLFYGSDINETCCKMAVINMVINTMEGEIAHMNTLTMEHYKSWHIRKVLQGQYYMPYYYMTGPGKTIFIQRKSQHAAAA